MCLFCTVIGNITGGYATPMSVKAYKSRHFDRWFNKYIELLSSGSLRNLRQCYVKPSEEKQEGYYNCFLAFKNNKGKHGTVLTVSKHRFTVAYNIPDSNKFVVHTTHKEYIFNLTNTQVEQYKNAVVQYNAIMNKWRVK